MSGKLIFLPRFFVEKQEDKTTCFFFCNWNCISHTSFLMTCSQTTDSPLTSTLPLSAPVTSSVANILFLNTFNFVRVLTLKSIAFSYIEETLGVWLSFCVLSSVLFPLWFLSLCTSFIRFLCLSYIWFHNLIMKCKLIQGKNPHYRTIVNIHENYVYLSSSFLM